MYDIACNRAIDIGPRIVGINGISTAAYVLTKTELKLLFAENGYSPRRSAWVKNVCDWTLWDVYISQGFPEDRKGGFVAFKLIGPSPITYLHMFAEDNDVPYFPHLDSGSVSA